MGFVVEKAELTKDQEKIVYFWKKNFPTWPEQKYVWFYQNNVEGQADCWWVKENNKNSIVGTAAVFPRKFRIKSNNCLAGITGDFGIDEQHRILGPALKLQREVVNSCEDGKYHFLYGFPNARSEPVQKRAGFVLVGSAIRMVKVMRSYRYLKRLLKIGFLARFISFFFDIIMRLLAKETWYNLNRGLKGKLIKEFDQRFDELWEVGSEHFTMIGDRSKKFLTWRFQNCPYKNYQIFILEKENDKSLVGYLVFLINGKDLHIVDCFARDKNDAYRNLIVAFLRQARNFKIDSISIEYLGNEFLINLLKEFNFSQRADKRNVVAYTQKTSNFSDLIKNPEKWYFLPADND